jgi:DNA-binding transcriptional LysR family regulator
VQLALVGGSDVDGRIELSPFVDDEIVGVAAPGLLLIEHGLVAPKCSSARCYSYASRAPAPRAHANRELAAAGITPRGTWELGSSVAIKRAAAAGLGFAFLSRYAVASEVERGELESFRLAGRPPLLRQFSVAYLAGRPLSPGEQAFIATLPRCCATSAAYAEACVAAPRTSPMRAAG